VSAQQQPSNGLQPRLLTKQGAAAYCGMSPATFDAICPVKPIRFSERTIRFDRVALDRWIDGLSPKATPDKTVDEWIDQMVVPTKRRK
jgi:predicted DNA-binding transcriptional regulator AlpA